MSKSLLNNIFSKLALFCLAALLLKGMGYADAQDLRSAQADQSRLLDDALARLNSLRQSIDAEQIPMARELRELENEIQQLESQLESSRAARDSASISLESLQVQVDGRQREYDYIMQTLFSELFAVYDATLSPGESDSLGESIRQLNLFLERDNTTPEERASASIDVLNTVVNRMESLTQGRLYNGAALNSAGAMTDGSFLQFGPVVYFQANDKSSAGWVSESGSMKPDVKALSRDATLEVSQFFDGTGKTLPVDTTLGDAVAMSETSETWLEHLQKGGKWVIPIILFALVALVVSIIKIIQIYTIREPAPMIVHDLVKLIREGDMDGARQLASTVPAPARSMLVAAVDHSTESVELVEEVMYESMLSVQPRLEKYLNIIAVTAATAPLLGLLGTVTGIIRTFTLMKIFGAGDPKPLLSGISEALITTELGLILAIPSLVVHAILSRRVTGILSRLEKLSLAFINALSRSGATQRPS